MTEQEIFDKVVRHLKKQGQPARVPVEEVGPNVTRCVYRTSDEKSCAVGCLIPDELYSPDIERTNIGTLIEEKSSEDGVSEKYKLLDDVLSRAGLGGNLKLLADLQVCHDRRSNWKFLENMRESLLDVARRHALTSEVVEECFPL